MPPVNCGTPPPPGTVVVAGAATHGPGVEAVAISGALAAEALVPGLLARPRTEAAASAPAVAEAQPAAISSAV